MTSRTVTWTLGNHQHTAGAIVMTDLGRIWRRGNLALVLCLAVPGALVSLERVGYFPSETVRQARESPGRAFLAPDFALPDSYGNRQRLSSFRVA